MWFCKKAIYLGVIISVRLSHQWSVVITLRYEISMAINYPLPELIDEMHQKRWQVSCPVSPKLPPDQVQKWRRKAESNHKLLGRKFCFKTLVWSIQSINFLPCPWLTLMMKETHEVRHSFFSGSTVFLDIKDNQPVAHLEVGYAAVSFAYHVSISRFASRQPSDSRVCLQISTIVIIIFYQSQSDRVMSSW